MKVADCSVCRREMGLVQGFGRDRIMRIAPHNKPEGGRCVTTAPDPETIREGRGGRGSRVRASRTKTTEVAG